MMEAGVLQVYQWFLQLLASEVDHLQGIIDVSIHRLDHDVQYSWAGLVSIYLIILLHADLECVVVVALL